MTKYVKVSVTTQYNIMRGVKPYRDTPVNQSINQSTNHLCLFQAKAHKTR